MTRGLAALATAALGAILAVTPAATAQNAQGAEVVISDLAIDQYLPQVAYNSKHKEYLVVWHNAWPIQSRDVWGKRLDQWGRVIDEFVITADVKDRAQPSVAYDPVNDRYLVAWMYDVSGAGTDWDIWGRFIPWNGPSPGLAEFHVNSWSSNQWSPRVAYAGTAQEFLVVWNNEAPAVPWYVSAQRITAATGALAGGAITVASGPEQRVNPDVAYNQARNEYLVVYQLMSPTTAGDIYAVRMTAGGAILGGGEYAIAAWPDSEEDPAVGASRVGDAYVVAWHNVLGGGNEDVYVRLVNGDGTIDGGPLHVVGTSVSESDPDVACWHSSTTCLVAWEHRYSNATGPIGVTARTVDMDHTLGDYFTPRPIFSGETLECGSPAIAAGPMGWLVAWEHDPDPATGDNQDIHARAAFQLFGDGFETGDTGGWSTTVAP